MLNLPFFTQLEKADTILLAGAGGGFDIFCGLPLYFGLLKAGKKVYLANLSFTHLASTDAPRLTEALVKVSGNTRSSSYYFPELYLSRWLSRLRGEEVPVYCFERTGVKPLARAYHYLARELTVDGVVLVDGGTDSLMRGDENGLGTPEEDVASLAAVEGLTDVKVKLLACLGFGIDTYHGVCHAQFLEGVAELTRQGAFLGSFSLMEEMEEVQLYRKVTEYVLQQMEHDPSIVSTSILSALAGHFGNYHANYRTARSRLFINPLMTLYWTFELEAVARRVMYLDRVRETETYSQLDRVINDFRDSLPSIKPWQDLPM